MTSIISNHSYLNDPGGTEIMRNVLPTRFRNDRKKEKQLEKFNKKLFVIERRRKKCIIAVAPGKSEKSFKVFLLPGKLRNKAFSIV